MKYGLRILSVIVAVSLQGALAPFIEINGGRIDFVLIAVISLTILHRKRSEAIGFALLSGVLLDLLSGRLVGGFTAAYLLVGYIAWNLHRRFYQDKIILLGLSVFSAYLLRELVYLVLLNIFTLGFGFPLSFEQWLSGALYTAVVFPLLYRGFVKLVRLDRALALRY